MGVRVAADGARWDHRSLRIVYSVGPCVIYGGAGSCAAFAGRHQVPQWHSCTFLHTAFCCISERVSLDSCLALTRQVWRGHVRRLHVLGYEQVKNLPAMDDCSLTSLHHNECVEVAFLAAPEIVLQVVVQNRPVSEVRVEIERESVFESTDEGGRCIMMLRPGRHVLRLLHKGLIVLWLEQEVVVTQARPCIVVSLPITLRTWRAPTVIGGRPHGCWQQRQRLLGAMRDGAAAA